MKLRGRIAYWLVSLALALALSFYAHRANAAQTFSGPGLFVSQNLCTDILNPVSGQSWCFDSTNNTIKYWSGTAWDPPFIGLFPLSADANFNNYSGVNVNQIALVQLLPPSSVTLTATCTGTCATQYTYEVTCLGDTSAETTPSTAATIDNATSLSATDFNTINWAAGTGCNNGYNVYGRLSGSLALLANVPNGTTTYVDTGAAVAPGSYKLTWSGGPAYPTVAVWDFRGVPISPSPFDPGILTIASGDGTSLSATGFTTSANHDLEVPIFGFTGFAGTFSPPAGFSNPISIAGSGSVNKGIWGGTKDIATAGAVATQTGSTVDSSIWASWHFAILSSNPSDAVTVVGTSHATATSPYTSVTFNDPAGTLSGDAELICVSWGGEGSNVVPVGPVAPAAFNLIGTSGFAQSPALVVTDVTCYWNLPTSGSSGIPPPIVNSTGILRQTTAGGTFEETLLGIQRFGGNSGNMPNGSTSAMGEVGQFPMPLTVVNCQVSWANYSGCSPFPTFTIRDVTGGYDLCSTGTVSGTDTQQAGVLGSNADRVTAANDILIFHASSAGTSCTTGLTGIGITFKE